MPERKYRPAQKLKKRPQSAQEPQAFYGQNGQATRKKQPQKERGSSKKRYWLRALAWLGAVVLACGLAACTYLYIKLGRLDYVTPEEISAQMGVSFDTGIENYERLSAAGGIQIAPGDIYHDPAVVNILLLGTDERTETYSMAARSDSMMILSINKWKNTWCLISLERAMGVQIPGRNDDWLTHTFAYGGPELTLATIRSHFKLDIDRYIRINFSAFEKAVDALGGIDIGLTWTEATYLNAWCGGAFNEGAQHLNGKFALDYARMRKPDSDWNRVQRQRNVITAIVEGVKKQGFLALNRLLDDTLPLVQTNLTRGELMSLALHAPFLMGKEMRQATLPAEGTFGNRVSAEGRSLYDVDYEANAALLRELLYS